MALELTDEALREEAALFTFQTLLLLRDSDLRNLRPHHGRPIDLPANDNTIEQQRRVMQGMQCAGS